LACAFCVNAMSTFEERPAKIAVFL